MSFNITNDGPNMNSINNNNNMNNNMNNNSMVSPAESDELPSIMPRLQLNNRGFISEEAQWKQEKNQFESMPDFMQNVERQPIIKGGLCLLIPGRPIITEFRKMSENQFIMSITKPGFVKEFCLSITDLNSFPKNCGIVIHYSLYPFNQWNILNDNKQITKSPVLYIDNPSKIFKSPWITINGITHCPLCYLGLELRPLDMIKKIEQPENIGAPNGNSSIDMIDGINDINDLNEMNDSKEDEMNGNNNNLLNISNSTFGDVAKRIGNNLYEYLSSFVKSAESVQILQNGEVLSFSQQGKVIVAPANALDLWFEKFKTKINKDKSFLKG